MSKRECTDGESGVRGWSNSLPDLGFSSTLRKRVETLAHRCLSHTAIVPADNRPPQRTWRHYEKWILASAVYLNLCTFVFGGDLTQPKPRLKEPVSETPLTLYRGYLVVVDGQIGSLQHQHFLVDTGSSPSMIDRRIAAKLGLHGEPRNLYLFNQDLSAETVVLPDLQLGPLHRQNLPVMVADFSKIERGVGTQVDAVIGLDVLGGSSFTIDYQKRRFLFQATRERYSAPLTPGRQFIGIDLTAGGRQLHLLLDTGTPQLILFQKALYHLDYDSTPATGSGQNLSGTVVYRKVVLPKARLGTEDVGAQSASVVASQDNVDGGFDGLIGVSVLRPKRLSFDFDRQILGWSN
jgi:aspartyl protease